MYEVLVEDYVAVNWERVVVNRKLLKWRAVRMPLQSEPVMNLVLRKVVRVLILRQEEVIVEAACVQVQELGRNVVEQLIFLLEFLQLLIKFQELYRMDLVLFISNYLGLPPFLITTFIVFRTDNLRIIACFPLSKCKTQEFFAGQLIHLKV